MAKSFQTSVPVLQVGATDVGTNGAVYALLTVIRKNNKLWSQLQNWEKEDIQFDLDEPTSQLEYDFFLQGIVIRLQNAVGLQGTGVVDESTWRAFGGLPQGTDFTKPGLSPWLLTIPAAIFVGVLVWFVRGSRSR